MELIGKRVTFPKKEKLTSKKIIEDIYANGQKIKHYPFILNYIEVEDKELMKFHVQIVIAVPKRNIKKAVGRNRIKRQVREAYRLNKADFLNHILSTQKNLALFLIYIGKEKENYAFIEKKTKEILLKLFEKLNYEKYP